MPASDRLLQRLQETLGDEPTRDLVSWVNEAGVVNRSEVREVADLYLSRFDERLERRLAEFEAKLERRLAGFEAKLEGRLVEFDRRLIAFDARFAESDARLERGLSVLHRDLLRSMFGFWAGTFIPLAGLMIALIKL